MENGAKIHEVLLAMLESVETWRNETALTLDMAIYQPG